MRCNFMQRDENKLALREAGVGDLEARFTDFNAAEKKNVEIEGARAVGDGGGAVAAELLFDPEQAVEKLARR